MNKSLFILALLGAILLIYGCTKTEDEKKMEPIDKFIGNFSGTYQLWGCGSGGSAQLAFTLENSSLSITKTGSESAEVACNLPGIGQVFKCQGVIDSDSTLNMPNCVHEGVTYDGKYLLRSSGGKAVNLFDPNIPCRFLGQPIGNVAWTRSN